MVTYKYLSSGLHHSCLISKPVQQKKKKRTTFAVLFFTIDGKLVGYRYTKTRWYDTNKTWCWQQRANWNHVWQCLVTDELFLQGDIDVSLLHVRFGNCLLPISVIFPSVQCTHTHFTGCLLAHWWSLYKLCRINYIIQSYQIINERTTEEKKISISEHGDNAHLTHTDVS